MTDKIDPKPKTDLWERIEAGCPGKSAEYKKEVYDLLCPEYKIEMLKDLIATMERTEEISLPLAFYGKKTKHERKQGGANSHEMSAEDRRERNESMQKEIDRLCLEKGHTFRNARVIVAKKQKPSLHPDTLKRIVKNPLV